MKILKTITNLIAIAAGMTLAVLLVFGQTFQMEFYYQTLAVSLFIIGFYFLMKYLEDGEE